MVTVYWMTNSTKFILFSVKGAPIATPLDSSLLCIFDHYSFIFCEAGAGTKLQLSVIYDIPFWQRMKNKLDFPTPFPDQLLLPPLFSTTRAPSLLNSYLPLLFQPMHVKARLQATYRGCVHTKCVTAGFKL